MTRLSRVIFVTCCCCALQSTATLALDDVPVHVQGKAADYAEPVPGVFKRVLWGDHDKGPYGAFTRFDPGVDPGFHRHTHDLRIVVIEGAYVYRDEDGEIRVGPGDYILVPGGKRHWSGGDTQQGVFFYESSEKNFDIIPAP